MAPPEDPYNTSALGLASPPKTTREGGASSLTARSGTIATATALGECPTRVLVAPIFFSQLSSYYTHLLIILIFLLHCIDITNTPNLFRQHTLLIRLTLPLTHPLINSPPPPTLSSPCHGRPRYPSLSRLYRMSSQSRHQVTDPPPSLTHNIYPPSNTSLPLHSPRNPSNKYPLLSTH